MLSDANVPEIPVTEWLLEPAGARAFIDSIPSDADVTPGLLQALETAMMEMKTTKPTMKGNGFCPALTSCATYTSSQPCPKLQSCGTYNGV